MANAFTWPLSINCLLLGMLMKVKSAWPAMTAVSDGAEPL
jgi:hypothetical protein